MKASLVSVVIPTHNRAGMVGETIASVLAQTHRPIEIIVVDDGSTDDTGRVVVGYEKKCPDGISLRYIHQENGGAPKARNRGIAESRADLVAFLDDDDLWLPTKLEKQVALMSRVAPDVGVVYCGIQVAHYSQGTYYLAAPEARGNVRAYLLSGRCLTTTSTVMVRKAVLLDVEGFDETLPSFQDYDLLLRISERYGFDYVREPLICFREHLGPRVGINVRGRLRGLRVLAKKWRDEIPADCGLQRMFEHGHAQICATAGDASLASGDWVGGFRCLLQAIRLDPRNPRFYLRLLLSLGSRRSYVVAVRILRGIRRALRRRGREGTQAPPWV